MNFIELTLHVQHDSPDSEVLAEHIESANAGIGKGDERWRALWQDPMQKEHLHQIESLVSSLQPCTNVVVIGIGGSSLGTKALHSALCCGESTRLFVLDNIDPQTFQHTIQQIGSSDPSQLRTVVIVVSKSGETAEINALYMAVVNALPNATYVAITGGQGALRECAIEKSWATLPVPDGVGGRFSVLSPVGLFPAAMCGIDIRGLLDGARVMDERCMKMKNNPAAELASGLVGAMRAGQNIHVMMPYCDRLNQFSHWYVQLWAESLGKVDAQGNRVGPTPVAAIGATDQHSMLQLWREGPADKVIGFIDIASSVEIPLGENTLGESQSWLSGQTLRRLLQAEMQATQRAVHDAGQSTWKMTFPELNAFYVGQFIALWQDTVAIAGRLMNINPYDQPGVELGKRLTKDSFS